jgi:hypothetical protein
LFFGRSLIELPPRGVELVAGADEAPVRHACGMFGAALRPHAEAAPGSSGSSAQQVARAGLGALHRKQRATRAAQAEDSAIATLKHRPRSPS